MAFRRFSDIAWDVVLTPIGPCGVAVGPRGVCRILLPMPGGARAAARALRREFSASVRDRRRCRGAAQAVRTFFAGRAAGAGPLDLAGATGFERRVYAALRRTAPGDVLTYSELARRIGRPRAARAVGNALGRNPFPLLIPCHRVVRRDGSPGGFSCPGGLPLKRRLLRLESALRS